MSPVWTFCVLSMLWTNILGTGHGDPDKISAARQDLVNMTSIGLDPDHEGDIVKLYQDDTQTATLNITCKATTCSGDKVTIHMDMVDPTIAEIVNNSSLFLTPSLVIRNQRWMTELTVNVTGVFMGKTRLRINVTFPSESGQAVRTFWSAEEVEVHVLLKENTASVLFDIAVKVMMAVTTVGFGCALELHELKGHFRRPFGIIIGFVCQFGILPSLAIGLAFAMGTPNVFAYGLLCLSCSPGGGASNVWSLLIGGDLNLSIAMTLISTLAALGMTPLWLFIAGGLFISNEAVIPYMDILLSLALLAVPCVVGLLIKHFFPKAAKVIVKLLKVFLIFVVIVLVVVGIMSNSYMLTLMSRLTWRTILPALIMPWSAYIISLLVALALRRPWKQVKTIAVETAIQNQAVALVVLAASFESPDEEYARFPMLLAGAATPLPLLITAAPFIFKKVRERIRTCKHGDTDSMQKEGTEPEQKQVTDSSNSKEAVDIHKNSSSLSLNPSTGKTLITDGKLVTRL